VVLVSSGADMEPQVKALRLHTDLSIGECCADSTVAQWQEEFLKHQVLVITAQVFVDVLLQDAIHLNQLNLLIFDDCEYAVHDSSYTDIMQKYADQTNGQGPRILGLTNTIMSDQVTCPIELDKTLVTLEKVLHCHVETSADIINVDLYGNKPQESVIECEKYEDITGLVSQFAAVLDSCMSFLEECNISFEEKDPRAIPKTVISECQFVLQELGPWCAGKVAYIFLKQLVKLLEHEPNEHCLMFMQMVFTQLTILHNTMEDVFDNKVMCLEDFLELMSPRIIQLIEILHGYKPDDSFVILGSDDFMDSIYDSEGCSDDSEEEADAAETKALVLQHSSNKRAVSHHKKQDSSEEENLCGVVFVERRHTAFVLNKLLVELCNWDTDLYFVKSHHICGQSTVGKDAPNNPLYKKQEEVLKRFRQKDLNLLISTSILEEGIDLPKCNLILKFDVPNSYTSYVQSKVLMFHFIFTSPHSVSFRPVQEQ
jgi:endoribonuclease Dicer